STESCFVVPDTSGNENLPRGSPTYSAEPSSIVLVNITATSGGVLLLTATAPFSCVSKPNITALSSIGSLWNVADTSTVPYVTASAATALSSYGFSLGCSFYSEIAGR